MDDIERHNFVLCCRGFSYTGIKLESYTRSGLSNLHQQIYNRLAGLPPCGTRCSECYGNDTRRWCKTCKRWKNALGAEHRRSHAIDWQRTQSWTWQTAPENIASVFIQYDEIDLCDIGALCNIWRNCRFFNIKQHITTRVTKLRNKHYGHNPHMRVTNHDKHEVFDAVKDVFKDYEIKVHVPANVCIEGLCDIEQDIDMKEYISKEIRNVCAETQANNRLISGVIEQNQIMNESLASEITQITKKYLYRKLLTKGIAPMSKWALAAMAIALLACYTFYYKSPLQEQTPRSNSHIASDCVSEIYSYPFPQDLPLLDYLAHHKRLVGREWLFEEMENVIFNTTSTNNGILLEAEIGYGKSAIMRHAICAGNGEKGRRLKEHVVAFHVCKFDVPSTRKAERLIRRLIGFFSSRSAEYGSEISRLNKHSLIYNQDACGKEPIACLDQGIISPLKKINSDKIWIVAIDALDECFDRETKNNFVLDLLSIRIREFPSWVKFLISSRNKYENNGMNRLNQMYLNASDVKNIRDLEKYIEEDHVFLENLNNLKREKLKTELMKNVLKQSEGNFLFIITALEYAVSRTKDMEASTITLPTTLTDIYEINFERKFPNTADYNVARHILQIICASLNPLTKLDISQILQVNNITSEENVADAFQKLSFFLKQDDEVRIIHQSLREWLVDKGNKMYHVTTEQGHRLFSNYLVNSINTNNSVNFEELAIHVTNSNDTRIKTIFKSLKHEHVKFDRDCLHRLIRKSSSVEALKLILPYVRDINALNDDRASPAFIAATRGHIKQLELLVDRGANYNFVSPLRTELLVNTTGTLDIFRIIKLSEEYFNGYNMLHIAAKFGHIDIFRYILGLNQSLIQAETIYGYLPSDIACKYGNLDVLKEIIALNKSTVGEKCVYLAARYGHEHVVDMLIEHNVVHLTCISDSISIQAFNKIFGTSIKSSSESTPRPLLSTIHPYDDWWLVFKESALHVAIRHGHTSVVENLLKSHPQLLNCTDSFGRTPFLASVWYNQLSIFKTLSMRLKYATEKCSETIPQYISDLKTYNDKFVNFVNERSCPLGASFSHIVATFDRFNMVLYVFESKMRPFVNWTAFDTNMNPPDHYAACAGSMTYLMLAKKGLLLHNIDDMVSANGSTVYHVAAVCNSHVHMYILRDIENKGRIPQRVDNEMRSILHYSVLKRPENNTIELQIDNVRIVNALIEDGHSLLVVDSFGRNVFHYSFLNGYHMLVRRIYEVDKQVWRQLVMQTDNNGYTPVTFALTNNNETTSILFTECLISSECNPSEIDYSFITPWELAILEVIELDKGSLMNVPADVFPRLFNISPYLTKAMLMHLKTKDIDLKQAILSQINTLSTVTNMFKYSMIALYTHKPELFLVCNGTLNSSPLHTMALNIHQYNDNVFFLYAISDFVHKTQLKKYLSCSDENGYNLFHYAVIGGNVGTAGLLLKFNITVTNKRVQYVDIPWMVLLSRFHYGMLHGPVDYGMYFDLDRFLSDFIKANVPKYKPHIFCINGTNELSILHVLSINGMRQTLKTISEIHGRKILSCTNKDGFTPHYIWRLFHCEEDWIEVTNRRYKVKFPNKIAEEILLFKVIHDFPLTHQSGKRRSLKCLFKYKKRSLMRLDRRTMFRIRTCLAEALPESDILYQSPMIGQSIDSIFSLIIRSNDLLTPVLSIKTRRSLEYISYLGTQKRFVNILSLFEYRFGIRSIRFHLQFISKLILRLEVISSDKITVQNRIDLQQINNIFNHITRTIFSRLINRLEQYVYIKMKSGIVCGDNSFFRTRAEFVGFGLHNLVFIHNHLDVRLCDRLFKKQHMYSNIMSTYEQYKHLDVIKKTIKFK